MARSKTGEATRTYCMIYNIVLDGLKELSREECGDLFVWLLEYSSSHNEPDMKGQSSGVRVIWAQLKRSVDECEEKYQAKVKVNQQIAKTRKSRKA